MVAIKLLKYIFRLSVLNKYVSSNKKTTNLAYVDKKKKN